LERKKALTNNRGCGPSLSFFSSDKGGKKRAGPGRGSVWLPSSNSAYGKKKRSKEEVDRQPGNLLFGKERKRKKERGGGKRTVPCYTFLSYILRRGKKKGKEKRRRVRPPKSFPRNLSWEGKKKKRKGERAVASCVPLIPYTFWGK